MNDYDFSRLNDKEFEVLCTDLIGASEGVRFERFKPGRDQGVDGRYFSPDGGEWILQAKHWAATPFSKLVAHLRTSEAPKIAALKPERYILVVSHPLSRLNKEELVTALGACCPVSVYGREDLNDLLPKHSVIERRHFKLWISSATVLLGLLNNAINGRSDAMMKQIIEKSKIYVQTSNFQLGVNKLNDLGSVIITGQPGIGKTTLAEQLILFYAASGYELVCISEHIQEAEQAWEPERPQLFYFDDFLGRNYLEALSGYKGSQIVHFIRRVAHDRAHKKFVLTSRSTILNQGRALDDVFDHHKIDKNEMEVRVESLSLLDKARILYNHIWHSGLDHEYTESFYVKKRYHEIIRHTNFNPRIIQFITDPQRLVDVPSEAYWGHIKDLLDNPAKIWEHPFDAQLDDFGRFLVLLVAFNGNRVEEKRLKAAYASGLRMPEHSNFDGKREFSVAIKFLSNSLLTRSVQGTRSFYKLFNPSLADFLIHRYAGNFEALEFVFKCLRSRTSASMILDLTKNKLIERTAARDMFFKLFEHEAELNFKESDSEYLATLHMHIGTNPSNAANAKRLQAVCDVALSEPAPRASLNGWKFLVTAINNEIVSAESVVEHVLQAIEYGVNENELPGLGDLVGTLEIHSINEATEPFTKLAHEFISNSLDDMFDEGDIFTNGEDLSAANRRLRDKICDKFTSWQVDPTEAMVDELVDAYDVPFRMKGYFAAEDFNFVSPRAEQNRLEAMDIDDLFAREQ
ncbi:restriction endonuclease [Pseudomonas fontis]|uniref:Restriction endonuclease type IV Mrr domain-containing protein n=1 Tax=Pseudomonas fontis TaxID=2942633 RepID=A0ABT5NTL8_9PSED|nr:restriction endonuclease [Pseudomonas fontis]MDD0976860.1 hypothetical protein [Pseudomonas fontis]MDD0991491.1 hypothetical protein [Pseudomonas fontis]